jgi:mono/diheme cytochrome c family protein
MRTIKRFALGLITIAILAMVFLVSGSAQTDVKYADAAQYYKDVKCVACHGPKADKKFNVDDKDEDLTQIILHGKKPEKPPNMPAYESKGITPEQAKALVDYMRELRKQ